MYKYNLLMVNGASYNKVYINSVKEEMKSQNINHNIRMSFRMYGQTKVMFFSNRFSVCILMYYDFGQFQDHKNAIVLEFMVVTQICSNAN